ncbi:14287_t:CDS:1, partial [Entrophospora sp. SA101]
EIRIRSKVLESLALRNKITKNIEDIKVDIALLKDVLEKIIDICQAHDTR